MSKINCILLEDEYPALILMENYINRIPELNLLGSFDKIAEFQKTVKHNEIDLMFLDIELDHERSIDLIEHLDTDCFLIFTTAYSEYAVKSYEYRTIDFLLKPFTFDRFKIAVNKAIKRIEQEKKLAKKSNEATYLTIKADGRNYNLDCDQLVHIQSMREYCAIISHDESRILSLISLAKLEKLLPENFIRVHRSHIVNTDYVDSYDMNFLFIKDIKIPIGRSYKASVSSSLGTQN